MTCTSELCCSSLLALLKARQGTENDYFFYLRIGNAAIGGRLEKTT